ncbi:hypothetical protein [Cognatilysobacter segetis]|uniref:hypothetical protein n=1 Tax=Cognatilysobacter segetis TaxID=2492394 RepID=UPI00105BC7D2|nr:hypothetical protein [Lysobacter segetis]
MKLIALVLAASTLVACSDRPPATAANTGDAPSAQGATPPATDAAGDTATNAPTPAPATPAPATPDTPTPSDTAALEADYLGRWTGVEGLYLVVAKKPGGGVTLEMQWDLDHKGTFDGSVTAEGLRFMRDGVAETAVRTNGDATGLKYLAGKKDCLTVKPGEGYCRD